MMKTNNDWHCRMCVRYILGDCSGKVEKCEKYETIHDRIRWGEIEKVC